MKPNNILTIVSGKNGTGTTLFATMLTRAIAEEIKKPGTLPEVALLSLNPYLPDSEPSFLLGLKDNKSLTHLVPLINNLTVSSLRGFFTTHAAGLDYIPFNSYENTVASISPTQFNKLLTMLSVMYSYLIIDSYPIIDGYTGTALDYSNLIFLLTRPDNITLPRTKIWFNQIVKLRYRPQLVKLILNFTGGKDSLRSKTVESELSIPVFNELPYDPTVMELINRNEPGLILNQTTFGRAVRESALKLTRNPDIFLSRIPVTNQQDSMAVVAVSLVPEGVRQTTLENKPDPSTSVTSNTTENTIIQDIKQRVHQRLLQELNLQHINVKLVSTDTSKQTELRTVAIETLEKLLAEEGSVLADREQRKRILNELVDDVLGLGPLEPLLRDESISEIMVNGKNQIFIERKGKLELTSAKFINEEQILTVIERIVVPLGRRIDETSPMVDARLKDGSRVNAIIPPLSLTGPTITIRKFIQRKLTPADWISFNSASQPMLDFIRAAVQVRKNIVISGGTGSGKTTLLNIVSSYIPAGERIVSIEDSAELKLPQVHWVRLESRPANIEGTGAIPIRQLVVNALRMRPDRIIVGECRAGETLDMLQAMNTGHDGSLTTLHANTPRDALSRIETMVLMSGLELPSQAIREQIASAINLIVQVNRFPDGTRKIVNITEITGMESKTITMQDIFVFDQTGVAEDGKIQGMYKPTYTVPTFIDQLRTRGIEFDLSVFQRK